MRWAHSQSPFSTISTWSSMICLEIKAAMGIGLEYSTSSHMAMNKQELAMSLREQRMGLSCKRSVNMLEMRVEEEY